MSSSPSTELHEVVFTYRSGVVTTKNWPTDKIRRLRIAYMINPPSTWIHSEGVMDLSSILDISWPDNSDKPREKHVHNHNRDQERQHPVSCSS